MSEKEREKVLALYKTPIDAIEFFILLFCAIVLCEELIFVSLKSSGGVSRLPDGFGGIDDA